MLPRDLKPEQFAQYPPEARKLAVDHIAPFRLLPVSFLPSLLREVVDYDYKFPAERIALEKELGNLSGLSAAQSAQWFHAFAQIAVSPKLEQFDWVNSPAQFIEQLSSHLWTTHQQDAFRQAATEYAGRLHAAAPPEPLPAARVGISVIGQGVDSYAEPLFRKLRPHGAYFTQVRPENGLAILLDAVAARAKTNPGSFNHWYIDGGDADTHESSLTCVSYGALGEARSMLLRKMRSETDRPGMGPEALRTIMAQLRPADLGMSKDGNPVLDRFQIRLLTEGSGTQIYSTSFTQWAAREALRRAQPLTLLVRFAPRQRQKALNELLAATSDRAELDLTGSMMDADMGAYYNWLNQQRLPGAEKSAFLVWHENHSSAVVIGPSVPRGTESASALDMKELLSWIV